MIPMKVRKHRFRGSWGVWCQECKINIDGFPLWEVAMLGALWHYNTNHRAQPDYLGSATHLLKMHNGDIDAVADVWNRYAQK